MAIAKQNTVTLKSIKGLRWDGEHRDPGFTLRNLQPGFARYLQAERKALPPEEADQYLAARRGKKH